MPYFGKYSVRPPTCETPLGTAALDPWASGSRFRLAAGAAKFIDNPEFRTLKKNRLTGLGIRA